MLLNFEEYRAMFEVEDQMWWYKTLHDRVVEELQVVAADVTALRILDAGCGTGGLLTRLGREGVKDAEGFDFNEHAVAFSKSRGLAVSRQDITNFAFPPDSYDAVISNDVLYQLDDTQLVSALQCVHRVLKPGGIFVTNNNAFSAFSGIHDIAVGSKRRFVKKDFDGFLKHFPDFSIQKATYWSLALSPLILAARTLQRWQLRRGLVKEVRSDVALPSPFVNRLLYTVCSVERKLISRSPFGSSLFLVIQKSNIG